MCIHTGQERVIPDLLLERRCRFIEKATLLRLDGRDAEFISSGQGLRIRLSDESVPERERMLILAEREVLWVEAIGERMTDLRGMIDRAASALSA